MEEVDGSVQQAPRQSLGSGCQLPGKQLRKVDETTWKMKWDGKVVLTQFHLGTFITVVDVTQSPWTAWGGWNGVGVTLVWNLKSK